MLLTKKDWREREREREIKEGAVEREKGAAESECCMCVGSQPVRACQPVIYGTETGSSLLCQLSIVTTDS